MKNRIYGWMQQTFKNGRTGSTKIATSANVLKATFTNQGIQYVANPGGYGYNLTTPPTPGSYYSGMDGKTEVNFTMGIDGDCNIVVERDGQIIYEVEIAPEHLSAVERDMPTVNIAKQP